jgi:hypothetical protein
MYSMSEMHAEQLGEERLWTAVIARAVQEWVAGPLRSQREAEVFLFTDDKDFPKVCLAAGLDAQTLRSKLRRLKVSGKGPSAIPVMHG